VKSLPYSLPLALIFDVSGDPLRLRFQVFGGASTVPVDQFLAKTHAALWIQHDKVQFDPLQQAPSPMSGVMLPFGCWGRTRTAKPAS